MFQNIIRVLTTIGSIFTIGFGIWHFFVPKIWNWYSYIVSDATELVTAVRAINVFFSLSLVLFGVMNILLINFNFSNRFSVITLLSATIVLWLARVALQLIYPQGSMNPIVQYGMLAAFILISILYIIAFGMYLFNKNI